MALECPNCRSPVPFLRAICTTAFGSFRCRSCGSVLAISFPRRLLAGGIWFALMLFAMEVLRLYVWGYWLVLTALLVGLVGVFYLCEKVVLLERRAFTCKHCGYDLAHLPEDRCPECGTPFDRAEQARILARQEAPPPKPKHRTLIVLVVVLLTGGVIAGHLVWRQFAARAARRGTAPTTLPTTNAASQP